MGVWNGLNYLSGLSGLSGTELAEACRDEGLSLVAAGYGWEVEARVTGSQVRRWLKAHGADVLEFHMDFPHAPTYSTDAVLRWLGY